MGEHTEISWTTHTFNTHWGCHEISPGCDACYARILAARFGTKWGIDEERRAFGDKHWDEPIKWNKRAEKARVRASVFSNSMSDLFDKNAPEGVRERLWKLIDATPMLDWNLLTKRIGNVQRMVPDSWLGGCWPKNARLGITVVNQEEADRDIPKLLDMPAHVRFLSCEPLLGPINLSLWRDRVEIPDGLSWVIVGAESGRSARPAQLEWIRSIVKQCQASGVAVHVKQLGKEVLDSGMSSPGEHWPAGKRRIPIVRIHDDDPGFAVRLDHKKGGDITEWPEDLRLQEFPA